MKIRYSNNQLYVLFSDDSYIMQSVTKDLALEIFQKSQDGATEEEIKIMLDPDYLERLKEADEIKEENEKLQEKISTILKDERFYYQDNRLYRQGIPVPIPLVLANKIAEVIEQGNTDEVNKLDNFWAWTSLIRNADSRESFYSYISKNKIPITKEGFVVGFRRANFVGKQENKILQEFVTQEYIRLRKNKKSTNVSVYSFGDNYTLKAEVDNEKTTYVGNLKELYTSFSEMEDAYESSRFGVNGRLKYRIGVETREDEKTVDWSNTECSRGECLPSS